MADCLTVPAINDFLATNSNMIEGKIVESLSLQSPWLSVYETKTFPAHMGEVLRTVVQQPVAPVLSECAPTWNGFNCRLTPKDIQTGTQEYQYRLYRTWERGPAICIADAYTAVEDALRGVEESLAKHAPTVWNAWLRYQTLLNSATKVTARAGVSSFQFLVAQGFQTNFKAGVVPNSPLTWNFLRQALNYVTQTLYGYGAMWGEGVNMHARLITDMDTAQYLRDEAETNLRAGVTGGFRDKYEELYSYEFAGPYRGIAIGVDPTPIRGTNFNSTTGVLACVEPRIAQATTQGQGAVFNPGWLASTYQISFLIFKGAFERRVPDTGYTGTDKTRFDKQFWGGDVFWLNNRDNDCNPLGEWGYHAINYAAGFKPIRPEFAVAILHNRCITDVGLVSCNGQYYISGSL